MSKAPSINAPKLNTIIFYMISLLVTNYSRCPARMRDTAAFLAEYGTQAAAITRWTQPIDSHVQPRQRLQHNKGGEWSGQDEGSSDQNDG